MCLTLTPVGPGWVVRPGHFSCMSLRVTMADIEKELAELRESQEQGKVSMEHSVSEASLYLQDQVSILCSPSAGIRPLLGIGRGQ